MMHAITKPRDTQMILPLKHNGQGWSLKSLNLAFGPDLAAISLRVTGWLMVNAFVVLGLFTFAALLIGDFTLEGAMVQLENLSSRYIAADALRRAGFTQGLAIISTILFLLTGFFRRGSLTRAFAGDIN